MKRLFIFFILAFVAIMVFAQQNYGIRIIGSIPDTRDSRLYQIQVGAFRVFQNAEQVFTRLKASSLNPSHEQHMDFTRVLLKMMRVTVLN